MQRKREIRWHDQNEKQSTTDSQQLPFFHISTLQFPAPGLAVVTGVVSFSPRFFPSVIFFIGFTNPNTGRHFIERC